MTEVKASTKAQSNLDQLLKQNQINVNAPDDFLCSA